jgi:tetratricopeptide (TPR) repeat protein
MVSSDDQVRGLLAQAYEALHKRNIESAIAVIEEALSVDFEHKEVLSALKLTNFWKDRFAALETIPDPFDCGEFLLDQWNMFIPFVERAGYVPEQSMYAIRYCVFGTALDCYEPLFESGGKRDAELSQRIGRCYKGQGNYEKAVEMYETAVQLQRDNPQILAELADAYALVNETSYAKVMFREAFFIDPQAICLECLESELIRRLIALVRQEGYEGRELVEWIPVFGVLKGVFSVKRELRSIEYGKLKQSVYGLEREIEQTGNDREILVPRLLNRYFWLIDHLSRSKDDRGKMDEVLLKIQQLDKSVYAKFNE